MEYRCDVDPKMRDEVKKLYFNWMMDWIGFDNDISPASGSYNFLCTHLYAIEFYAVNPMDENRADDARHIRQFFRSANYVPFEMYISEEQLDYILGYPSVLEVLIGIAFRWERDLERSPLGEWHVGDKVLEMFKNLGLDIFTNKGWVNAHEKVGSYDKIVRKWLDREFDHTGKGSPWPVYFDEKCEKNGQKMVCPDQKLFEMWYQLNNYLAFLDRF